MDHEKEKNLEDLLLKPPSFAERPCWTAAITYKHQRRARHWEQLEDKMSEI
jgi:hypothetical protein